MESNEIRGTSIRGTFTLIVMLGCLSAIIFAAENHLRYNAQVELSGIRFDAHTGWRYVTRDARYDRKESVGFNSLGFRDHERTPAPAAGVRRVLVVGDSYVAGLSVSPENTIASIAELELNARAPTKHFEVIPTGVSGWSTDQELAFLAWEGLSLQPTDVVLLVTPNDIRESYAKRWIEFGGTDSSWQQVGPRPPTFMDRATWWLADHSAVFQWIQQKMGTHAGTFQEIFRLYPVTFELEPGKPVHDEDVFRRQTPESLAEAYRYEGQLLDAIATLCKQRGVFFRMGVIPTKMEFDGTLSSPGYDPMRVRDFVLQTAKEHGVPWVDIYLRWGDTPLKNYLPQEYHFNDEGHLRAGRAVAASILNP